MASREIELSSGSELARVGLGADVPRQVDDVLIVGSMPGADADAVRAVLVRTHSP